MMLWQLCLLVTWASCAWGFPTGPPDGACSTMTPQHPPNVPQETAAPYEIQLSRTNYSAGDVVTVTLKSQPAVQFTGFMLQARSYPSGGSDTMYGTFNVPSGTRLMCPAAGGGKAVSHDSNSPKSQVQFTWTAPNPAVGHLRFYATFVQVKSTFWVMEPSAILEDPTAGPVPTTAIPTMVPITPIDTTTCGKTKGCYRDEKDCTAETCQYLATWEDQNDRVRFELSAQSDGWVALGFSTNTKMGDDSVVDCTFDEAANRVKVQLSYNVKDGKGNELLPSSVQQSVISGEEGSISDGRIRCRFVRMKQFGDAKVFDLKNPYYLLAAKGRSTKTGAKLQHSIEPKKDPMVSPQTVDVSVKDNIFGRLRYPLVKAHGCFMIIAWMFCVSLAIIMARFYKPMWPNDQLCANKVWFSVHRTCNLTAMVLTIVAFILIFIHAGGYSQLPGPPFAHSAHPILGIIVTVLCIVNPFMAIFRCHPGTPKRPIFNWLHWAVGTLAHVISIPALIIGVSLAKASVPWWATWILVAFIIFHVLVEITLEIHNCGVSKKNKERDEQFEMQKKQNPNIGDNDKPKPAGHRFKSIVLGIYTTVAVCLTIVMVITVAVS